MPIIVPLFAAAVALTGSAAGAAPPAFTPEMLNMLPPPGLYRLEAGQGITRHLDTPVTITDHKNGATGTVTTTTDTGENHRVTTTTGGRSTTCRRMGQQVVPESATFAAPHACKNLSLTLDGNTLTMVDQCSIGRMTSIVRKLSDTTWENAFDVAQPVSLPGDAWGVPELLEASGTPEQREQARQVRRIKTERDAQAAADIARVRAALNRDLQTARTAKERASARKAIEVMAGIDTRQPAIRHTHTERWTLISRTCGAVKPGPVAPALQR